MALLSRRVAVLPVAAALAACTYSGGDIGDALQRKATWLSYVAGDDIRSHCEAGSPDRFRVVYNAVWSQQLRMYDLDSLRKLLITHATRPTDSARFSVRDPLGPWQAGESRVQLDDKAYDALVAAFAGSGMFAPPPVGLDLPSRSYFWSAAYCRGGHYGFTGWAYPSPRFAAITFDKLLFQGDRTGVAVIPAGPVPLDPEWESEHGQGHVTDFTVTVGRNGPLR